MRHWDYPSCKTSNRRCSFDAHFQDGAGSVSLLLLPIKEANTSVMTICNHCPLWIPRMQDLKWLTLRWRSFPGWVRERLSTYFEHKSGQYIQNAQWRTIVNIIRLTLGYLNATMNRTTWNAIPEIRPGGLRQTRRNQGVDSYGAGFGLPRSSGSGFWQVLDPNQTVFPVQIWTTGGLPAPIVTTRYAGLVNSAMQIELPRSRFSGINPINRTLRAHLHRHPPSIRKDLESKVAPITNNNMFIFGRYLNL